MKYTKNILIMNFQQEVIILNFNICINIIFQACIAVVGLPKGAKVEIEMIAVQKQ